MGYVVKTSVLPGSVTGILAMFQCYVVTHYLLWKHPSLCPHNWHRAVLTAFHDARFCTAVTCYYGRLTESSNLSIYYHSHPRNLPNHLSGLCQCINIATQSPISKQTRIPVKSRQFQRSFLWTKGISATETQNMNVRKPRCAVTDDDPSAPLCDGYKMS